MSKFTKEDWDTMSDEERKCLEDDLAKILTDEIDKELGTTKEERDEEMIKAIKRVARSQNI